MIWLFEIFENLTKRIKYYVSKPLELQEIQNMTVIKEVFPQLYEKVF